jgi:hypothetical protein
MQRIYAVMAERLWLRAALLVIAALAAMIALLPHELGSSLALKSAWLVGSFLPAIAIGVAAGWLAYSKRVWLFTTAPLLVITVVVLTISSRLQATLECQDLSMQAEQLGPRMNAAMDQYQNTLVRARRPGAAQNVNTYQNALDANGKMVESFGQAVGILERGEREGCFGTATGKWNEMLSALKTRYVQFRTERKLLVKTAPPGVWISIDDYVVANGLLELDQTAGGTGHDIRL